MENYAVISINIMLLMFSLAGIDKIMNYHKVVKGFVDRVPFCPTWLARFLIICAIVIELFAPIMVNYGLIYKKNNIYRIACLSLIVFTILATIVYHFPPLGFKYYPFMSNLTTVGGLMLASTLNF